MSYVQKCFRQGFCKNGFCVPTQNHTESKFSYALSKSEITFTIEMGGGKRNILCGHTETISFGTLLYQY